MTSHGGSPYDSGLAYAHSTGLLIFRDGLRLRRHAAAEHPLHLLLVVHQLPQRVLELPHRGGDLPHPDESGLKRQEARSCRKGSAQNDFRRPLHSHVAFRFASVH